MMSFCTVCLLPPSLSLVCMRYPSRAHPNCRAGADLVNGRRFGSELSGTHPDVRSKAPTGGGSARPDVCSLWLLRHGQSEGNVIRDAALAAAEELDIPTRG